MKEYPAYRGLGERAWHPLREDEVDDVLAHELDYFAVDENVKGREGEAVNCCDYLDYKSDKAKNVPVKVYRSMNWNRKMPGNAEFQHYVEYFAGDVRTILREYAPPLSGRICKEVNKGDPRFT